MRNRMSAKISVIVPVYNAEKTLAACLGNLVHQTFRDLELILVNDASTDNSLSILLDCERAFPDQVILVNLEENSGPGGARNAGLMYASGDYIGFVDSDDIADVTMFEKLYQCAVSGNYDMVDCIYYDEARESFIQQTDPANAGTLDLQKRIELMAGGGYLWSRLFRRELFDGITFREHTILEDMEILMLIFLRTGQLGVVAEPLYRHTAPPDSASRPTDPVTYQKAVTETMTAMATLFLSREDYAQMQEVIEYSVLHLYYGGITHILHAAPPIPASMRDRFLAELRQLRFRYVTIPYENNHYLDRIFQEKDIELMQWNDRQLYKTQERSVSNPISLKDSVSYSEIKIQFLNGGLANQAFQYIFARYYELSHPGSVMYLDDSYFALHTVHNGYELEKVFGLHPHMLSECFTPDSWEFILNERRHGKSVATILAEHEMPVTMIAETDNYREFNPFSGTVLSVPTGGFFPKIMDYSTPLYYHGYWINRKWFDAYRDVFLREFRFPPMSDQKNQDYLTKIRQTQSVSTHVRRGDYVDLNWAMPIADHRIMIDRFLQDAPGLWHLFVFSDDIPWCRAHKKELGFDQFDDVTFIEGNLNGSNYIDLFLMSRCRAMILSRSAFCYLAALLNTEMRYVLNLPGRDV